MVELLYEEKFLDCLFHSWMFTLLALLLIANDLSKKEKTFRQRISQENQVYRFFDPLPSYCRWIFKFLTQDKSKKLRGRINENSGERKTNDFNQRRYRSGQKGGGRGEEGGKAARKEEIKKFLRAGEFELGRQANVYACRMKTISSIERDFAPPADTLGAITLIQYLNFHTHTPDHSEILKQNETLVKLMIISYDRYAKIYSYCHAGIRILSLTHETINNHRIDFSIPL